MRLNGLLLFCAFVFCTSFTFDTNSDRLCKDNEQIVFSFLLTKNHKVVSVCKDKQNRYLVYRFGTKDNIELVYPAQLDNSSLTKFKYYYVHRGGGIKNAGFGDVSLSFTNDNVTYKIYHDWRDEVPTNDIGIEVTINGRTTNLKGDLKTQIGALQDLDFEENEITNSAEDE